MLGDKGKFVMQILNYSRILNKNEKIVAIHGKNGFTFVRYYEFHNDYFNFNILKFNSANPEERVLSTTKIYPYTKKYVAANLKKAGFCKIKYFGNLKTEKFSQTDSKDLVIIAEKL